jgi:hypothetical protein
MTVAILERHWARGPSTAPRRRRVSTFAVFGLGRRDVEFSEERLVVRQSGWIFMCRRRDRQGWHAFAYQRTRRGRIGLRSCPELAAPQPIRRGCDRALHRVNPPRKLPTPDETVLVLASAPSLATGQTRVGRWIATGCHWPMGKRGDAIIKVPFTSTKFSCTRVCGRRRDPATDGRVERPVDQAAYAGATPTRSRGEGGRCGITRKTVLVAGPTDVEAK